jgi:glycosyltransferase involved in cell wall biosynthesis
VSSDWRDAPTPVGPLDDLPPALSGRRVKVLHILTKFEAGAGGNTLLSATGMDPARYDMWILGGEEGPLWVLAERAGIRTVPMRNFRRELDPVADFLILARLIGIIRRERFSVVHTHNAKGGFLGRLAAWYCRTPVVVYTLHGRDPWWRAADARKRRLGESLSPLQRWMYLALEKALRPMTDGFVAVAPRVAQDAVESRIAPAGKIVVVPSAVDLDAVPTGPDPQAREELGIPRDAPVVGTVGRLDAQKAPLDFVRMCRIVADDHADARFVWVGEGPLLGKARAEAERLGVDVTFTGHRPDAPRIASMFDVYVVSSLYEGVGRSLTEALASGRPVVATAVDGIVDVVFHGATGLLARPRDPRGLAERVGWMLDHPREAAQMGAQARDFVRSLFTQTEMCERLDRLYCKLLGIPVKQYDGPAQGLERLEPAPVFGPGDLDGDSIPAPTPARHV